MSCKSRQQGLWWQPLLLSKLIKVSGLMSREGKRGSWEGGQSTVLQFPRHSNVSIMGCEHSDEDGTRRRGKEGKGVRRMGWGGGNEKGRVMCHCRDESSTDGLPPGCLSREIAFDVMLKTEEKAAGQEIHSTCPGVVWWFLMFPKVNFSGFLYVFHPVN